LIYAECLDIFAKTISMEPKDIIRKIRKANNLTQEQMAEKLCVTRQAISRWETGATWPNPEMLKIISKEFGVSINTLLGSPQTLFCQHCGMTINEDEKLTEVPGTYDLSMKIELWEWLYNNYSKKFYEEIIELIRAAESFDAAVTQLHDRYSISNETATEFLNLPFVDTSTMNKEYCKKELLKYSSMKA